MYKSHQKRVHDWEEQGCRASDGYRVKGIVNNRKTNRPNPMQSLKYKAHIAFNASLLSQGAASDAMSRLQSQSRGPSHDAENYP